MTEPAITPELVQKHSLTPEEYEKLKAILGPRAELHRAGHLLGHVERALLLQEHPPAAEDLPHQVPEDPRQRGRGKRGHHRHRRRPGHRVQDRVAQSPQRRRAVPGRGHRRRRHHPRHFHDGRAARVLDEFAAVRPDHERPRRRNADANAQRTTAGSSPASSRASPITAIASASRPSRGEVYFDKSYEGNPLVNAFCLGVLRHEQIARGAAKRRRQPGLLRRPGHRPRRPGGRGVRLAGSDRGIRRAAARRGAGGRSVHGEARAAKPAWNCWPPAPSPASRTWARPA